MGSGVIVVSMANFRLVSGRRVPPRCFNQMIEPDLDLEQVAALRLEGPSRALPEFRSMGTPGDRDSLVAVLSMIGFADISLQKTAKTARSGRGQAVCERAVPPLPAPTPPFHCRPFLCQI